jgi:hypothetical protein
MPALRENNIDKMPSFFTFDCQSQHMNLAHASSIRYYLMFLSTRNKIQRVIGK